MNMGIALTMWLSIVLLGMTFSMSSFLAHLQPAGASALLYPFLCIIELVKLTVRPITLAVRLTANLSTGHILMALLGTGFVGAGWGVMPFLLTLAGVFYFMFEMVVCLIQAYIFTLLPCLYANEHPKN